MKEIVLLGSTGSVGRNVLDVIKRFPEKFRVKAISSNKNVSLLAEQAEVFSPDTVAVGDKDLYGQLKESIGGGSVVSAGPESLEELAAGDGSDIVFIAISGIAALKPLIAALKAGKTVALASKEPIVSAGMIIKKLVDENGSNIIPVDSEHSAVMQCISGKDIKDISTLYITGTGGPLRNRKLEDFDTLSIDEVLNHPTWNMGPKITVDSATLMNKGLEVIEAHWLFDVPPEKIKVIIHPEATIHSMVEFVDGTVNAGLFSPDMRFPIIKALAYPEALENDFPKIDFSVIKNLSFSEPDGNKFPALKLAFDVLYEGGTLPAVLNGANEAAVKLFLGEKIKFTGIVDIIKKVIGKHKKINDPSLEDIIDSEKWAMEEVLVSC